MKMHAFPNASFLEKSPFLNRKLFPSNNSESGTEDALLSHVAQKGIQTVSHTFLNPKPGGSFTSNPSRAFVRKKREGQQRETNRGNQLPLSTLFQYQWINETIHAAISNDGKIDPQLYGIIMPQLFDEKSLLEFVSDQIKNNRALLNHELKAMIQDKINQKGENGLALLDETSRFFIHEGIRLLLPALYLKNNRFPIHSETWGYLHAGSRYILNCHRDPLTFPKEEISLIGSFLMALAYQNAFTDILPYFQEPTILYFLLRHPNVQIEISLGKAYTEYFEALMEMHTIEEKIILKATDFLNTQHKTRKELVKEILDQRGIEPHEGNVVQYIAASNHPILSKVKDFLNIFNTDSEKTRHAIYDLAKTREPIDVEYDKQNQAIAEKYAALEREHLKLFFISMYPEDKEWIKKADVYSINPVFTDTNIPHSTIIKPEAAAIAMRSQTVDISKQFDLYSFSTTVNNQTRFYILKINAPFNYSLFQVDKNRDSYVPFLPDEKKSYPHFKFSIFSDKRLKRFDESIDLFFDSILEKQARNYKKELSDGSYDTTTFESIARFAQGMIPLHDFIEAIKKGNHQEAVLYFLLDALGLLPVFGAGGKMLTQALKGTKTAFTKIIIQQSIHQSIKNRFLKKVGKEALVHADKLPVKFLSKQALKTKKLSQEIAMHLDTLRLKPLSDRLLKETSFFMDPSFYSLYLMLHLEIKLTWNILKNFIAFVQKTNDAELIKTTQFAINLFKNLNDKILESSASNIKTMATEGEKELSVIQVTHLNETNDYVRIDPNTQILFGPKYILGKDHKLLQKRPHEMFHDWEPFVPDEVIEETVEKIDKQIDAGCFVSISYPLKKRYENDCQITEPSEEDLSCSVRALQVEADFLSIELKSFEKKMMQLAEALSELDPKSSIYKNTETTYFSLRIEFLIMQRRSETYQMLIETLTHFPHDTSRLNVERNRACFIHQEAKEMLGQMNQEIDAGCFISVRPNQKKRYESRCQIEPLRPEELLYTIAELKTKSGRLSTSLESLQKILDQSGKTMPEINRNRSDTQTKEKDYFSLKMQALTLQRRKQTYRMVIEKLTQSSIYTMRLVKDLFLNDNPSSREIYTRYLNQPNLFEISDEEGNGVLHYLAKTTSPKILTFFFRSLLKQPRGLKEAITRPNRKGVAPLGLLIQNPSLEKYTQGPQGMFGRSSEFFHTIRNPIDQNTLFDQILAFFEKNLDKNRLNFHTLYLIFNEAAKTVNPSSKPFVHKMHKHWKKVEMWVRKNLSTQLNATYSENGLSLFHEAIKKNNAYLVIYLTSYTSLEVEKLDQQTLYALFDFASKNLRGNDSIEIWMANRFFSQINHVDSNTGDTFLHQAARAGNVFLMEYLINRGANTEKQNNAGDSPIDSLNTDDISIVYELFHFADRYKRTPFDEWVKKNFLGRIHTIDPENGETFLHKAVHKQNVGLILYLINLGINHRLKNNSGYTPASQMIQDRNVSLLYRIFDAAALHKSLQLEQWIKSDFLGATDVIDFTSGETLLHLAAKHKNVRLIRSFIDLGADSTVKDKEKKTPLFYMKDQFTLLYDLFDAASQAPGSKFEEWVKQNIFDQMNVPSGLFGNTLLHQALINKDETLIAYLKKHGAREDIADDFGKTAKDLEADLEDMDPQQLKFEKLFTHAHAIKKRTLDSKALVENQTTLFKNPNTYTQDFPSLSSESGGANLLSPQEMSNLYYTALLLKRAVCKTKNKGRPSRRSKEIDRKKILCGKTLDEIEGSLSDPPHFNRKDKRIHNQIKEEWQALKETFKGLLDNHNTTIETFGAFERHVQALQARMQILEHFHHLIETLTDAL